MSAQINLFYCNREALSSLFLLLPYQVLRLIFYVKNILFLMKENNTYWVWAQFTKEDADKIKFFQDEIRYNLNGPIFEPHLTLSGPIFSNDLEGICDKLRLIVKYFSYLELETNGINLEQSEYQGFYIDIILNNRLKALKDNIDFSLNIKNSIYHPHISLHYGDSPTLVKKKVLSLLKFRDTIFKVDRVSVADVDELNNKWNVIHSIKLQ